MTPSARGPARGAAAAQWFILVRGGACVHPFLLLLIGLAAGTRSGMFGIEGGVVIVPAPRRIIRMPVPTATGTSLAVLLLPVALLGAWAYSRTGQLGLAAPPWIAGGPFALFLAGNAVRLWTTL